MRILVEGRNHAVGIEDGLICPPAGDFDVVITDPTAELRPGLINPHEHLHRNHYGRLGAPPYTDADAWGLDIHERSASEIGAGRSLPRREAFLRGAWKNLFCGVTTVVHHDAWPETDLGLPIRLAPVRWLHTVRSERIETQPGAESGPLMIHLAEGVGPRSAAEVRDADGRGLLTNDLLAVHAVGVDEDGVERLLRSGAAVVWCPSSNHFLFGRTAPAALFSSETDVLVGSDSLLTASGDLLDELRFARSTGLLPDERLREAVGAVAARRLHLPAPTLEPGAPADLILIRADVLAASAADVALVMVDGTIRLLDPVLPASGLRGGRGEMMKMGEVTRWVDQRSIVPRSNRHILSR